MLTNRSRIGKVLLWYTCALVFCISFALVAARAEDQPEAAPEAKKWYFEAGPSWRTIKDVRFSGASYAQTLGISTGLSGGRTGNIGPMNAYANRDYDDGFVYMDLGTAAYGDTWYWRNASRSQIIRNSAGSPTAIAFHSSRWTYDKTEESFLDGRDFDAGTEIGFQVQMGRLLKSYRKSAIYVNLGFSNHEFGAGGISEPLHQTWYRNDYQITDVRALPSGGEPMPSPDIYGPGTLINNIPDQRSESRIGRTQAMTVRDVVREDADVTLSAVSFGLRWKISASRVGFLLGAGLAANYVGVDAERTEDVIATSPAGESVLGSWRDSESESEWIAGAFGNVGLCFDLSKAISLSAQYRYDFLFDDVELSVGPSKVDVDVEGHSFMAGVAVLF